MGLLDDAIREHLELKRQHGADPGEVARQEHEALGNPRRGDLEAPPADAAPPAPPAPAAPAPPAYDDAPPADLDEPHVPTPPPAPAADAPAARSAFLDDPAPPAPTPSREPEPAPQPPRATEPPATPTADDGEDELEETPDFLQDAPEHDRLWFEQRPPRDFDF